MATFAEVDFSDVPEEGVLYPKGDYPMMVTKCEMKTEKDNANHRFVLVTLRFMSGPYQNKDVTRFLYINHTTRNLWGAKKELASLLTACGVKPDAEVSAPIGKTVLAKIEINPDKKDPAKLYNNFSYAKREAARAQTQPAQPAEGFAQEVFGGLEKQVNAPLDAPCWPVAS